MAIVTKRTPATQLLMATLASNASAKPHLTDKPFLFLPPVFFVSTEAAMLRLYQAEAHVPSIGPGSGGIAVRTDQLRAYQLTQRPHTAIGNWQQISWFKVWRGAAPAGQFGDFGAQDTVSGWQLRRWTTVAPARWEAYSGWRGELRRIRSQLFQRLFPPSIDAEQPIFRDNEWYVEPRHQSFRGIFSDEVLPWNTGNTWSPNWFRPEFFKDARYVYTDNGTPTTVDMVNDFQVNTALSEFDGALRIESKLRAKGRLWNKNVRMNIAMRFTISHPIDRDAVNYPGHTRINGLNLPVTIQELPVPGFNGRSLNITFTATNFEWDGGEFEIGVRLTPPYNGYQVSGGNYFGTLRFTLGESEIIDGVHNQFPVRQIALPDTGPDEPTPWAWQFGPINANYWQPFGPVPQNATGWTTACTLWRATPSGVTNGIWLARPLPLSNVEFEQNIDVFPDTQRFLLQPILQRYRSASSYFINTGSQFDAFTHTDMVQDKPTTEDFRVSKMSMYQMPAVYIREIGPQTTQADLLYQQKLWMAGRPGGWRTDLVHGPGMVYSVTIRRLAPNGPTGGIQIPEFAGPRIPVHMGYCYQGTDPHNIKSLGGITLERSEESTTVYPAWPLLDGTALVYKRPPYPVQVWATIIPASPGASKAFDPQVIDVFDSTGSVTPIMAAHYNDTQKMIDALNLIPP